MTGVQETNQDPIGLPFVSDEVSRRKALPEQMLMLAVLEDAMDGLLHGKKGNYDSARRFLLERDAKTYDGKPWLFGFESICEHLGFDPDYIRNGVFKRYFEQVFGGN